MTTTNQKDERHHLTDIPPVKTTEEEEIRAKESPLAGALAGVSRAVTRAVASVGKSGISGTLAGMSEEVAGYPLDIVKTRMQVHEHAAKQGAFTVLKNIVKHEGVRLFAGLGSPLLGAAFLNAVLFGAYERSLAHFQKIHAAEYPHTLLGLPYYFYAGAIGGAASTLVTCPVDVVKNKMQVMGLGHGHAQGNASGIKVPTTLDVTKSTFKSGGIRGLYLGMAPTIYRDVPGYGIYFAVYESLKRQFPELAAAEEHGDGEAHGAASLPIVVLSGGSAGCIYHAATYPFDVVKSVIQTQPTDHQGKPLHYKNTADCFKQIYQKQGWRGFTKGIGPTVIRSFPASGVGFAVYELTLKILPK